ncbi:GPI mannosyltransferase 2 [Syncephalis pseudoplumigaleata]|uniref:GPI mannosyltransferase 2 n=1 Tax=Syncephalis pseudoplumigaleata TaxID=1712513 RepID=A0A4P9Z7H8_9FUNG|nr:GPI mannosyltransferase 2 [Syncephalis pseudoplumigaleata]|eukprot:RKP27861.1 GPI mannosyltransferase 2 [Syncephalis pseudoplumigaleata]
MTTVVPDNRRRTAIVNRKLERLPATARPTGTWTPLERPLRTLARLAVASRFAVFSLALASHRYIRDYDASVDTLLGPDADADGKLLEPWLRPFASVYLRWDAFYFLHIAEEGYLFEQEHAFFPLLPLLMRWMAATVFSPLHYVLSHRMVLLLSGIVISNVAFILAACSLYRQVPHLSLAIFNDRRFAFLSGALFCLTPSAMFMSSIYTESIFALLSFTGMELYAHGRLWPAAAVWSLSSLARSNGIVYAGFFVYELLIRQTRLIGAKHLLMRCLTAVMLSAMVIGGMACFQWYGYQQYCLGDTPRPWCQARVPLLYSFVQVEYWNCGFLRYFEWKQLPNFALALPMLVLSAMGIVPDTVEASTIVDGILPEAITNHLARTQLYFSPNALPFIYLWALLLLYAFTSMHVQVITRFFSSMHTHHVMYRQWTRSPLWPRILLMYFVGYGLCGVVLFSNFFPPA